MTALDLATIGPPPAVSELLDFLEEVPVARDGPCIQHCLRKTGRVDCYDRSIYRRRGYSPQRVAGLARVPLFYDERGTCSCQETGRRCTLWCRIAPAYPLLAPVAIGRARFVPGLHLTYSARTCVAATVLDPRYVARADLAWRRLILDNGRRTLRQLKRAPGWWGARRIPEEMTARAAEIARALTPPWAVARDVPWEELPALARALERERRRRALPATAPGR